MYKIHFLTPDLEPATIAGADFSEAPDFVTFLDERGEFTAAVKTDRILMVEKVTGSADREATGA